MEAFRRDLMQGPEKELGKTVQSVDDWQEPDIGTLEGIADD